MVPNPGRREVFVRHERRRVEVVGDDEAEGGLSDEIRRVIIFFRVDVNFNQHVLCRPAQHLQLVEHKVQASLRA